MEAVNASISLGRGRPLEPDVRQQMETRLGHDFRDVRVHDASGATANFGESLAYALGEHVVFSPGHYRPRGPFGRWILAHELTHVVQQRPPRAPATGSLTTLEGEANKTASAFVAGSHTSVRPGSANPHPMLLTPAQFRAQLGSTPEQAAAIDSLFANSSFIAIWNWVGACTATPAADLGPLSLRVTPGLMSGGVERFGGYSPLSRTLEINPTKPEHVSNPTELVDTIAHELIHAADDLRGPCTAARSGPPPMGAAATTTEDTSRARAIATGNEARLNVALGPGASDPCAEFIDINEAAQATLTSILTENIQSSRVGRPTVTFVNAIIRADPTALSSYEACRTAACALSTPAARTAGVAACSRDVIGRFLPSSLIGSLFPTVLYFDSASEVVRAADNEKLDLVALFLTTHPATTVRLIGHADERGSAATNLGVGQRRAEAVRAALTARAVPAAQITSVTSTGEAAPLATGPATYWRDRTVEIVT